MNAHVQIPTNIDGIEDELASRMSRGDDAVAQRIDTMHVLKAKGSSERDKGKSKMSDVVETQSLFDQAFPIWRYGSVKAAQNEAVRVISRLVMKEFTHRRARAISEGRARRIDGEEKDAFRIAAENERLRKIREAKAILDEHRREQDELRSRLAALDARLAMVDEAFHGPQMEAYRAYTGELVRVHHDGEDR